MESFTEPALESATTKKEESSTVAEAASSAELASATDGKAAATNSKTTADEKGKLNATGRSRLRWLLHQGFPPEEAAEMAKKPLKIKELRKKMDAEAGKPEVIRPKKKKKKNKPFNFDTEYQSLSKAAKKALNWLQINGYTEEEAMIEIRKLNESEVTIILKPSADGLIRVAIAPQNYPASLLTNEQSNTIKSAIQIQMLQQNDSELKPRFDKCEFIEGYLLFNCSDQPTVGWLQQNVPKLELWEDASVKVLSEKSLLKTIVLIGNFGDSGQDTNEDILKLVESQNDGLSTANWRIVTRTELSNKQTVELSFTVNRASYKLLHSLNFKINYKLGKITLRKKEKPVEAVTNKPFFKGKFKKKFDRSNNNSVSSRTVVPQRPTAYGGNNQYNNGSYSYGSSGGANQPNSARTGYSQYNNGSRNGSNPYGSNGGANKSNNRPYSLVESLYDQMNCSATTTNVSNDQYGSRRGGGGGGSGVGGSGVGGSGVSGGGGSRGNNQYGSNYSSPGSSSYGLGRRSFFTTSKLGFF